MSARLILAAAVALGLSPLAQAESAATGQEAVVANPLLKPSTLEFGFPHFDQLKDAHYAPAIEQGMREQLAEVEAIANQKDAPTFDNTIVALEKTGDLYYRATAVFFSATYCSRPFLP